MTITERIDKWIMEQEEGGKTRDELHNTHFVIAKDTVAIITKSGRKGYNLKVLYPPHTVNFMD